MLGVISRTRAVVAAAGLCLGWMSAGALAAPPVLDRVPDNAMLVVASANPSGVQKNLQSLVTATELPIPMVPRIEDMLAGAGITDGLDTARSLALVLFAPPPGAAAKKAAADEDLDIDIDVEEDERVVILLPITGYEALLNNFEVKPGGGIDSITMPDGKTNFIKDVGEGYAAMSPDKALLTSFEAKSGASSIKSKLGAAGDQLSDRSDIVTIINMDVVRPMWPELRKQLEEQIQEQAQNLPIPGEAPNPMENAALNWLAEAVVRDGRALIGGLKTGNTGIHLDFAVNFTEGSPMGEMFTGTPRAGALLAKLPSAPYLFAGALDFANPRIKAFVKELAAKGADMGNAMGMGGGVEMIDKADGAAFTMGVPVGGVFGGLTTSTISYTASKDPVNYIAGQKTALAEMNGKAENDVTMETSYKDAGAKVDGADVDEYSIKLKVDPNSEAAQMAPQFLNAIFGPTGGPAGYIAKVDGGVYQTFGRNSQLLSSAIKAGNGGDSLGGDTMLAQVGAAMPGNRLAELYIGTKGILDLVVPAAAMFTGVQIPPDQIPDSLPPIGAGLSSNAGAAHFSVFVPAPVIRTAAKLGMTVQEQMDGMFGGGEDEEMAPEEGGKPGTGQPRF